jgi:hypothetical protein
MTYTGIAIVVMSIGIDGPAGWTMFAVGAVLMFCEPEARR